MSLNWVLHGTEHQHMRIALGGGPHGLSFCLALLACHPPYTPVDRPHFLGPGIKALTTPGSSAWNITDPMRHGCALIVSYQSMQPDAAVVPTRYVLPLQHRASA